jgi:hypothetical protein
VRIAVIADVAWDDAARQAEQNGRPDWAAALRTGFMPKRRGCAAG